MTREEANVLAVSELGSDAIVWFGDGHSGTGWYAWSAEYPDEGSTFLCADEQTQVQPQSEIVALLAAARDREMTPAEREEQRRSFAYGNAAISNPHVTREMVDRAAEELAREGGE